MTLSPLSLYQQELLDGSILPDPAQQYAVEKLDQLFELLQQRSGLFRGKQSIQGLYLWGSVGVGKTYLMDLFHSCLPDGNKLRLHYNHFIARIHDEMRSESGKADPLKIIARRLAKDIRVLCLDELYITDIGDAMIVYNLFNALFEEGMVIVITSNFPVDKLYKDELQPRLFEPAINLIKKNTRNLRLDGDRDYRLLQGHLLQGHPHRTYFLEGEKHFNDLFIELDSCEEKSRNSNVHENIANDELVVCGRSLPAVRHSQKLAWFSFDTLCNGPRSKLDYIELANRFSTIMISDVPELGSRKSEPQIISGTEDISADNHARGERKKVFGSADNAARRFMTLVDELYDRGVNLYLSAQVPLDCLYVGEALVFEFQRTRSRLVEMQSLDYLQRREMR